MNPPILQTSGTLAPHCLKSGCEGPITISQTAGTVVIQNMAPGMPLRWSCPILRAIGTAAILDVVGVEAVDNPAEALATRSQGKACGVVQSSLEAQFQIAL